MEKQKQQPQRLQSLDALRGFDMLFIMGGASLFVALATLFPNPLFQVIAGQMEHVDGARALHQHVANAGRNVRGHIGCDAFLQKNIARVAVDTT